MDTHRIHYIPPKVIDHTSDSYTLCDAKCTMQRRYTSNTATVIGIKAKENDSKSLYFRVNMTEHANDTHQITFNGTQFFLDEIRLGTAKHTHIKENNSQVASYEMLLIHKNLEFKDSNTANKLVICIPMKNMNESNTSWVDDAVAQHPNTLKKNAKIRTNQNKNVIINLNDIVKIYNPFFFYRGSPLSPENNENYTIVLKIEGNVNIINITKATQDYMKKNLTPSMSIAGGEIYNPTLALNKNGMLPLGASPLCPPCENKEGFATLGQAYSNYDGNSFNIWPYDKKSRLVILLIILCALLWYHVQN